jgi:hypothetical protein
MNLFAVDFVFVEDREITLQVKVNSLSETEAVQNAKRYLSDYVKNPEDWQAFRIIKETKIYG